MNYVNSSGRAKKSLFENTHAFLSPSQPSWLNYTAEKLRSVYRNRKAAERGTQLHDLARRAISLGVRMPKNKKTINQYVNDSLDFGMEPEVFLYYSQFCYGTADALADDGSILRISDLKTGESKPKVEQLMVYAALYCLEREIDPADRFFELRIYHTNLVTLYTPTSTEIGEIISFIEWADKELSEMEFCE